MYMQDIVRDILSAQGGSDVRQRYLTSCVHTEFGHLLSSCVRLQRQHPVV